MIIYGHKIFWADAWEPGIWLIFPWVPDLRISGHAWHFQQEVHCDGNSHIHAVLWSPFYSSNCGRDLREGKQGSTWGVLSPFISHWYHLIDLYSSSWSYHNISHIPSELVRRRQWEQFLIGYQLPAASLPWLAAWVLGPTFSCVLVDDHSHREVQLPQSDFVRKCMKMWDILRYCQNSMQYRTIAVLCCAMLASRFTFSLIFK